MFDEEGAEDGTEEIEEADEIDGGANNEAHGLGVGVRRLCGGAEADTFSFSLDFPFLAAVLPPRWCFAAGRREDTIRT